MKNRVASGRCPVANDEMSGSRTRALCAPEGFQLGFERRPISAVFGLFGARLGIERFAQCLALARKSEVIQIEVERVDPNPLV